MEKGMGGLGVGSIRAKNLSLLGKRMWRFHTEDNALWRKVIIEIYSRDGGFGHMAHRGTRIGLWNEIVKSSRNLMDLENNKDSRVCDRWCLNNRFWTGNGVWRIPFRGRAVSQLASLKNQIGNIVLYTNRLDSWHWVSNASGIFSVKSLSTLIQRKLLGGSIDNYHFVWNSWVRRKVSSCLWRASLDRLPTRVNLIYKGITVSLTRYLFCENKDEDLEHCLILYPSVRTLWLKLWNWWKCGSPGSFSLADILLNRIAFPSRSQGAIRALYGACYVLLWPIWRWCNKLLHASSIEVDGIKHEYIFPSIQRLWLLWISNRSGMDNMNWRDWSLNPCEIVDM
ncbi:RNA-directed DNA polymerase, eukaryota, reverse transcriptase zinc-binding domain protein [Tanacetum coccineum]